VLGARRLRPEEITAMRLPYRVLRAFRLLVWNRPLLAEMIRASRRGLPKETTGRATTRIGDPKDGVLMEIDLGLGVTARAAFAGSYEVHIVHRLRRSLKPGDVAIDVGANIGYLTAVMADAVGVTGEVHAFEPSPQPLAELQRLPALNPRHTIRVNAAAVGERPGTAELHVGVGEHFIGTSLVPRAHLDHAHIQVPVVQLGAYIAEHGLSERVGAVKIDVEGFEIPALRGLADYVRRARRKPTIVCEVTPQAYDRIGLSVADLTAVVRDMGYVARTVDTMRPVELRKVRGLMDVVLVPDVGA
jgi:FkbM family methyltransferase